MLEAEVIEPSTSPWTSPIVPVHKKDGSVRLCIDSAQLKKGGRGGGGGECWG